jgi:Tol biopolymer transport system component
MKSFRWAVWAAILSLVVGALLAAARPQTASGLSNCSASQLVPALREVMVNQGVANYTYLVRGKDTLVKFFLSNPTTCTVITTGSSAQSINVTAATLSVNNTIQTFPGIGAFQSFAAAPAVSATLSNNSSADPVFAVPANDLVPLLSNLDTNTFNPTFTATITYSRKSGTTTTTGQTVTYSNSTPVTFDHRTRALRVLVVPMGDGTPGVLASTQYTAADQTSTQNGFSALSRIFPVPSDVASLGAAGGGIRYTINLATMLNLKAIAGAYDGNGKFCGVGGNFDGIKAQLAQFMQSWNSNPLNVGKQVDRVLGVVGEGISDGADSPFGCADGMASVVSPEAWVRAISDKPASGRIAAQPSRTGSLMAMELTHTWGGATTSTFHSANIVADGTAPGRAYNVTTRSYLATNRSVMKYSFISSPPWDDTLTLLEPAHYGYDRCAFGGTIPTTTTECTGLGSIAGTTFGVAAGSSFIVSGVVHSSTNPPTAEIVQSGFLNSLQLGRDDNSQYRYVRRASTSGQLLTNIGFHVSFTNSLHGAGASENDDPATFDGLFSFALPDTLPAPGSDLAEVQLWKVSSSSHTNPSVLGGDTLLYDKTQQASAPQVLSINSGAAAGATKYTDTQSVDELHPALTDDTNWVAWNQRTSSGFQRIKVAPATSSLQAVEVPSPAGADATEPAWNSQGTALAYESDGDLYTQGVNLTGATPTFAASRLKIYDSHTAGNPPAHHPTWSRDGTSIAFDRSGDIYKMPSAGGTLVQLTNNGEQESDPSWSHTPGDNRIAYNRGPTGCELCFPATKLYVVNAGAPKFPQTKVNDDGAFPSFGTNGRIAFVRHSDQNIWSTQPDGTDTKQLTTGGDDTLPSAAGSALAFDRIFTPPGQADIMLTGLSGGQAVTFTAQSNVPLKAELDYECNGTAYPVRVGLVPDEVNGAVQTFNTNFDGSISCGGGVLRALVTDGVQYASGAVFPTTVAAKAPTAAIFTPLDALYSQSATFALSGTGYDAEGRVLPASNLHWTLTLPNATVQDLGNFSSQDLRAPPGGWPLGTLTFTLVAGDGSTSSAPVTRNVHVGFDFVTGGFLPPIVNPPQVNSANAGSTIPIKWQLKDVSGNFITDLSTVQPFPLGVTYQSSNCSFTQPFGDTVALPTGGTSLRYDTSTNQFVYNWATPTTSGCYVFTLSLIDGTQHQAYFNFK